MPVFFFIQCDLDVHASRSFFCLADSPASLILFCLADSPASPLDHGRCNAPAPSGKFSLLTQIRIFHPLAEMESKCDSGLDREKKGLVQVHCTCRYPSAELGRTTSETLWHFLQPSAG